VRLLRATVLQSTHQFSAALSDLRAVLAADPANAQAWLTQATVQTVQGDYTSATASCARVSALSIDLAAITCLANVGAVTGKAATSEQLLDLTLSRSPNAPDDLKVWALTLLAEMAQRRGDAATAESRFRQALDASPHDSYLQGAYADLLLDQGRAADVLKLLQGQERIDALLLRRALALQQADKRQAMQADVRELAARFDAAGQRGDTVHQREQARFELWLRRDVPTALALARKNWAVQKEPADLRIYLEAAAQARDAGAAKPAADWIAAHRTEDVAATRLLRQLKAGS
jgi:predicted Zn-dependent protease